MAQHRTHCHSELVATGLLHDALGVDRLLDRPQPRHVRAPQLLSGDLLQTVVRVLERRANILALSISSGADEVGRLVLLVVEEVVKGGVGEVEEDVARAERARAVGRVGGVRAMGVERLVEGLDVEGAEEGRVVSGER